MTAAVPGSGSPGSGPALTLPATPSRPPPAARSRRGDAGPGGANPHPPDLRHTSLALPTRRRASRLPAEDRAGAHAQQLRELQAGHSEAGAERPDGLAREGPAGAAGHAGDHGIRPGTQPRDPPV